MSNGSTARCRPSGPTGASTPATPNAQRRLHPGSSTTTISAATPHSEATPPPTGCHQRDGRVQLTPDSGHLLTLPFPKPRLLRLGKTWWRDSLLGRILSAVTTSTVRVNSRQ